MRRIAVIKTREILRLDKIGLSLREIASACSCGKSTVSEVLQRAQKAKIIWPTDLKEKELLRLLYPPVDKTLSLPEPDVEYIFYEMKKRSVTLMLLWEEYKEVYPHGLMYTQFCSRYRDFKKANRLTMHIEHKAGEEMQVDWAGYQVPYINHLSGEKSSAYVFVAVLPASAYPFVYAYDDRKLANWIDAHIKAFEYFQGVARILIPDNTKTAVITPDVSEPVLNKSYNDMANHYGIAIVPARRYKAKDKAADENMVGNVSRRILAPLRNVTFFSLDEINAAIRKELLKFIERPFAKMEGNRISAFEKIDRPALMALPKTRYEYSEFKEARIGYNYHVEYEKFYYSTDYAYAGNPCFVRATKDTLEVFVDGERIAAHKRNYNKSNRYSTDPDHMPEEHKAVSGWSTGRFISWAESVGPYTEEFIKRVLKASQYPVQSYRSCMAIMSHAKNTSNHMMETVCQKALELEIYSYKYFNMLLKKESDVKEKSKPQTIILHANLRGKDAYAGGGINA
jgi:transposase